MKKSNWLTKMFTVVVTLMATVNIICGLFWSKGFYYLKAVLAIAGIIALLCLFGGKLLDAIRHSQLKQRIAKLTADDFEVSFESKDDEEPEAEIEVLSRAEYEAKMKELFSAYEKAIDDSDYQKLKEVRAEMDYYKSIEPPKLSKEKELEDLHKLMGI